MKKYVVGFLFSPKLDSVVLIKKNKPDWQRNKLNGVGGSVECGETPYEAMVREFREEAGYQFTDWEQFLAMEVTEPVTLDLVVLFFFRGTLKSNSDAFKIYSATDEHVAWYDYPLILDKDKLIPNLRWLIPLALSGETGKITMNKNI